MDHTTHHPDIASLSALIAQLEERISRIEHRLSIQEPEYRQTQTDNEPPASPSAPELQDDLEYQVGQNWFAKTGIVVLAIGMALLLTFPFPAIPSYIPSLAGGVLVVVLSALSRAWRDSFPLLARYLFGAAMALMYFAVMRLCFFSAVPALNAASIPGIVLLLAASLVNTAIALRRRSMYLLALAVTCMVATILTSDSIWLAACMFPVLATFASVMRIRFSAQGFFFYGIGLVFFAVLLIAIGNPLLGRPLQLVVSPLWSAWVLLLSVTAFSAGTLFRSDHRPEEWSQGLESAAVIVPGFGLLLGFTAPASSPEFVGVQLASAATMFVLAIAFWVRDQSTYTTFFAAMTGYFALTLAIVKGFSGPSTFVWLALESIVVVATAVWFRSRFIVVANFFIYLSIIVAYLAATPEEHGMALGFGVVALISARILNWQQHRLALKTEAMRNAYLGIAFLVFPYALYHLVPREYVSLSWIGIAGLYYALNGVIKAQKYRWMGHLTLILTVLYVVIIGIIQLDPAYRVVSFLALAIALLAVSMAFTRLRARKNAETLKTRVPT